MSSNNPDKAYHGSLEDTEHTLFDHRSANRRQYDEGYILSVAVNNITFVRLHDVLSQVAPEIRDRLFSSVRIFEQDLESWSRAITEPIHPPVTSQDHAAYPLDSPTNPLLEAAPNTDLFEALKVEIAQLKETSEAKAQEPGVRSTTLQGGLKIVSESLHAAASKRNQLDEATDERRAFEGALLLIYQGDEAALSTFQNLIAGTDDDVLDTEESPVDFTFAQLKDASPRTHLLLTLSTPLKMLPI